MGKNSGLDLIEMEAGEEIESKMDLYKRVDYIIKQFNFLAGPWFAIWSDHRDAFLSRHRTLQVNDEN